MSARFPAHVFLVLALLIAPQFGGSGAKHKRATPPTAKDLVGVWMGFDSDQLTFTRLDLRADLTGFCARVSPADTSLHAQGVHVYRVTKWAVNGWSLELHMTPISNATAIGYVKGRIDLGSLRLTIGGPENGGWKEETLLESESRTMASNREARAAIEGVEKR
jgi:hypothetical protein